jgi:hypothetical protein
MPHDPLLFLFDTFRGWQVYTCVLSSSGLKVWNQAMTEVNGDIHI